MLNQAYLSLGSNIEPEQNLATAVQMLATLTRLRAVSKVWETPAWGDTDQPNFLNAAALVETKLTADQLKQQVLNYIELCLGRVRQLDQYVPRPIDLDLMLFNREIIQLGRRHIPDPEIVARPFVAIPLAELAPTYHHPQTGQTLAEIAGSFVVKKGEMRLRQDVTQALAQIKAIYSAGT
jgi:2-amino-4-hydroxy-6-hydroxymethyldihydropteridine diphosphokinase